MNLTNVLCVFLGSGLGGVCRYLVGRSLQSLAPGALFTWGTFAVNIGGCFLIGLFYGLFDRGTLLSPQLRMLLTVGFCGGFTTFSTFINENYLLFGASGPEQQTAHLALLALYVASSVLLGFAALYAGHWLAR